MRLTNCLPGLIPIVFCMLSAEMKRCHWFIVLVTSQVTDYSEFLDCGSLKSVYENLKVPLPVTSKTIELDSCWLWRRPVIVLIYSPTPLTCVCGQTNNITNQWMSAQLAIKLVNDICASWPSWPLSVRRR